MFRTCPAALRLVSLLFLLLAAFTLPALAATSTPAPNSNDATQVEADRPVSDLPRPATATEAGPDSAAPPEKAVLPALPAASTPADKEPDPKAEETAASEVDRLFSPVYHACMDEAAATVAMQDCMNAEGERLDKHIAQQRAALALTLSAERAKAMDEALIAWEALRTSGSAAMYDPEGGTLATVTASLWYLEQSARTARWLDGLKESTAP